MQRIDVLGTVIAHGSIEPAWAGTVQETAMNAFNAALVGTAFADTDWAPRDPHDQRRHLTAAQDALADFAWPGAAVLGRVAACATAIVSHMRSRASYRLEPGHVPVVDVTVPG